VRFASHESRRRCALFNPKNFVGFRRRRLFNQ
jgi:hypothetical protein